MKDVAQVIQTSMGFKINKAMSKLVIKQLGILLWKSWIMRRRHWISTIFELVTPLLLSLLIAYIYSNAQTGQQNEANHRSGAKSDDIAANFDDSSGKTIGPRIWSDPTMVVNPNDRYRYKAVVYYGPTNSFTDDLMARVKSYGFGDIQIYGLANEALVNAKMESFVANESIDMNLIRDYYGVIFGDSSQNAESIDNFKYTIRMIGSMAFQVNHLFPTKYFPGPAYELDDYTKKFCPLQTLINEAYLSKQTETSGKARKESSSVKAFRFPYPKYVSKGSQNQVFSVQDSIAGAIIIGYVVLCPLIVKRITDEKVAKAKEMLRMMGMSDWVFWGSHFISYFTLMLFHCVIFSILYCVGLGGDPVMNYSDGFLFFVVLTVYCAQSIVFCMLITTVFNRPVLAVVVTVIIWIISYGVPLGILNPLFHKDMDIVQTNPARLFSSILPNMGLSWCLAIFGQFEVIEVGAQWSGLYSQTSVYSSLTLGLVMSIMLLSCFGYGILIWYIDAIWPFQYGVPKPFYFPCLLSYWCPSSHRGFDDDLKSSLMADARNFESEPETPVGIKIRNLRKEFGGIGSQRKVAVHNVSLNIYGGQITVLLGHNGAGKTTTMNMITGIFPPTSGSVHVDGYNVETETNKARRSLGLCPQENIIYNELTVAQHLKLYAILKGYPWNLVDKEVDNALVMLKLVDKKHALAESLSGGMKRKLALGIAMIGGTKILILDEPTSGMDPEARRAVWDLLQSLRTERTILLTTHYMEEADVLGDRIAIMCEGKVKCCGSPMFLKKRFGAGYHLRISKGIGFNCQLIEQVLRRHLPKAHLHSEIQSEIIYSLESNDRNNCETPTAVFPSLFDDIERNKEKLGIASCGLTITTMEDVFLRVGHEIDDIDDEVKHNRKNLVEKSSGSLIRKNDAQLKDADLFMNRVIGLLVKRFHFAKRYWPMMCFQLLVPGLLFIVVLLSDYSIRSSINGQTKNLRLNLKELYGNTYGFYQSSDFQDIGKYYGPTANNYGMNTTFLSDENPNNWALKHADNLENYIKYYLIGAVINRTEDDKLEIASWFNNEATHSLPISLNLIYEALLKYFIPEKAGKISITVNNHPLSLSENRVDFAVIIFSWIVSCLLLIPITVPFIGASYVLFPINERTSKAKLLQLMTGLSSTIFWICNFLFDLINHLMAIIIIYVIFAIFDFNKIFFYQTNTAFGLFLMLFLFGFASIPLAYCFSLWLKKPSTGFAVLVIIYLLFGLIANSAMGTLDLMINVMNLNPVSKSTFNLLLGIFRLVPVFSMSFGIQKLYRIGSFAQICRGFAAKQNMTLMCYYVTDKDIIYGCCQEKCGPNNECYESKNPLQFDRFGVGQEFVYMVTDGLLFMIILLILEGNIQRILYRFMNQNSRKSGRGIAMVPVNGNFGSSDDSDVVLEQQRIESLCERGMLNQEALAVIDLAKRFRNLTAVDHLTFGIHKEECFGLLGVNGAGKTTTFSMLTGDLMLSEGNAFIGSYSLRNDLRQFQKQIGYCPQFDALLDKLTGKEMLYLFARLRGVPSALIPGEVEALIQMVDLQNHASKCTETYSGGNRRKLSLALAIIGTPPVIFLDEPTAGVDPAARRKVWSTLVYIQEKYQSAIVLTSHSMEECEALCSRIAIMVNGKFKCLGPTQHLRTKFGQGFTIVIKLRRELNDDPGYVVQVQQYIQRAIPSAVLRDAHQCLLHYHVTDTSVQWSHLFRVMESAKGQLQLEDYLVSDTTLEQIFLAFARSQRVVH